MSVSALTQEMKFKREILTDPLVLMILAAIIADSLFFPIIFQTLVHSRYFKIKTTEELKQIFSNAFNNR